ncbi:uncharacterized protein PHALS_07012 [Plasmopara halstedii]|uniref:RxLR-like protein n=1 Tax=Plasmopara halstedii TaxID=4781 RepID=A0A0P1B524_PLAHL|nr:uncharacterized protein PHALS_07012 [Plasmopara halstedii]CEG49240.1 hypothetical protein PHALS_07012 [Plasmopara halstedii]|eukprot:XP_024585609.1 hypothetical protein PHALS_07012 [Plasmopara halstedii]
MWFVYRLLFLLQRCMIHFSYLTPKIILSAGRSGGHCLKLLDMLNACPVIERTR